MNKLLKVVIIGFFFLSSSCSNNIQKPLNVIEKSNIQKNYVISGIVDLKKLKNSNFKTKAFDINDITQKATVTLLYPDDYMVPDLRNTAIVSGVTNSSGEFKMNPLENFTPINEQIYILEVTKRVGGIGTPNMSLRTILKWNGVSWDSITTPNLYITVETTAIAILAYLNKNNLTYDDTIGKITMSTDEESTILYDTKINNSDTSSIIWQILDLLNTGKDPIENISSI